MNKKEEKKAEKIIDSLNRNKEIWLLKADDGLFAMFEDEKSQQYVAAWTSKKEAENHLHGEWSDYVSEMMPAAEFIAWLDELKKDNIRIGFITGEAAQAMPFDATELKDRLNLNYRG